MSVELTKLRPAAALSEKQATVGNQSSGGKSQWYSGSMKPFHFRFLTELTTTSRWFVPRTYVTFVSATRTKTYTLSFPQRIFLLLDRRSSCYLAKVKSAIMIVVILLSVINVFLSTNAKYKYSPNTCHNPACHNDPELCPGKYICEPKPLPVFSLIDIICISIYTIDFGARVLLVGCMPTMLTGLVKCEWEKTMWNFKVDEFDADGEDDDKSAGCDDDSESNDVAFSSLYQTGRYLCTINSAIDLASIIPSFIIEIGKFAETSTTSFIFLRILRFMQALKLSGNQAGSRSMILIISRTFQKSKEAILVLLFYFMAVMVIFACVIYIFESGEFMVTAEHPHGAYLRPSLAGDSLEVSPFDSITTSAYWSVVTLTTLGYGDLFPTSSNGRIVASTAAFLGILCIAMPASVLGSNLREVIHAYRNFSIKKKQTLSALPKIIEMQHSADPEAVIDFESGPFDSSFRRAVTKRLNEEAALDSDPMSTNSGSTLGRHQSTLQFLQQSAKKAFSRSISQLTFQEVPDGDQQRPEAQPLAADKWIRRRISGRARSLLEISESKEELADLPQEKLLRMFHEMQAEYITLAQQYKKHHVAQEEVIKKLRRLHASDALSILNETIDHQRTDEPDGDIAASGMSLPSASCSSNDVETNFEALWASSQQLINKDCKNQSPLEATEELR